ncbi:hypothetical protein B4064_2608 [Caldibacillus thermoamylovorans]|nr:hypothetical protein B4064_2608 [Caldibacillus thermoamylovorans]
MEFHSKSAGKIIKAFCRFFYNIRKYKNTSKYLGISFIV